MNEESATSDLEEGFQESEIVDSIDNIELITKHKVWDIVRVKDRANKPYILLGKEGEDDTKFWFQFHGESKEDMSKYVEWKISADKLSVDKKRSPEELDYLRRVCLSVGVLSDLIRDEEFTDAIMTSIIGCIAKRWYDTDHPDAKDAGSDDEMTVYCELVYTHIKQLCSIVTGVVGTMMSPDSSPIVQGE